MFIVITPSQRQGGKITVAACTELVQLTSLLLLQREVEVPVSQMKSKSNLAEKTRPLSATFLRGPPQKPRVCTNLLVVLWVVLVAAGARALLLAMILLFSNGPQNYKLQITFHYIQLAKEFAQDLLKTC